MKSFQHRMPSFPLVITAIRLSDHWQYLYSCTFKHMEKRVWWTKILKSCKLLRAAGTRMANPELTTCPASATPQKSHCWPLAKEVELHLFLPDSDSCIQCTIVGFLHECPNPMLGHDGLSWDCRQKVTCTYSFILNDLWRDASTI